MSVSLSVRVGLGSVEQSSLRHRLHNLEEVLCRNRLPANLKATFSGVLCRFGFRKGGRKVAISVPGFSQACDKSSITIFLVIFPKT